MHRPTSSRSDGVTRSHISHGMVMADQGLKEDSPSSAVPFDQCGIYVSVDEDRYRAHVAYVIIPSFTVGTCDFQASFDSRQRSLSSRHLSIARSLGSCIFRSPQEHLLLPFHCPSSGASYQFRSKMLSLMSAFRP